MSVKHASDHTSKKPTAFVARSSQTENSEERRKTPSPLLKRVGLAVVFLAWVTVAFIGAQLLLGVIIYGLVEAGVEVLATVNESVFQAVVSALVYALSLAIAVGVPWVIFKTQRLTWKDVGFAEPLPSWRDIGIAPIVFVLSLVASVVAMFVAAQVLPGVDLQTEQQIGFENVTQRYEMLMAFLTLVVLAPVFEEVLFRGYLYGRVRRYLSTVWTVILTSLLFGMMHVYAGPDNPLQWNVVINTTVLALCIGALRAYTGNVWAAILVHMLKNGVAFFALFVLPLLGVPLV